MSSPQSEHIGADGDGQPERDLEMELVLELSKKTFMEEEKRRQEQAVPDLIEIEDPHAIQRRTTINQIQDMCNRPPTTLGGYGFTPRAFSVLPHPISHHHSATLPTSSSFPGRFPHASTAPPVVAAPFTAYVPPPLPNQSFNLPPHPPVQKAPLAAAHHAYNKSTNQLPPPSATHSNAHNASFHPFNRQSSVQLPTSRRMADRTPRRQSHAESSADLADLIDLSNGNSSAFENAAYETPGVEEFDPLFARALSFQSAPDLQLQADSSQMPRPQSVPSMQSMESSVCTEETTIDEVSVPPFVLNDHVQVSATPGTNFAKQLVSLAKYRERISKGLSKEKNVYFIAPTVDYMTTTAGTIKVVVTTDKTWPFLEANVKRKLTFTCNVNQTCAEILSTVLLEFLPPEELSKNEGQIPLDEYVLKSNRTDEFFDNEAVIGKHPFVGFTLAVDKDVELMVGRKVLPVDQPHVPLERHPRVLATTLTADHFRGFLDSLLRDLQKERPDKGRVSTMIGVMRQSMNHTLSLDVVTALNSFATANRKERIKKSVKLLTDAVLRQLYVFSRSAVLDLSFKTQLVELPGNQQNVEELSTFIENDFMICVESLHNIPHEWSEAYSRYHVEFELQNALVELNFQQTPKRAPESNGVTFEAWFELNTKMYLLPRTAVLSFAIYGERKSTSPVQGGAIADVPDGRVILATALIPVFDHQGYLLQGPFMLGLAKAQQNRTNPWGPQTLIQHATDPILYIRFMEYDYQIEFPREIHLSEQYFLKFEQLSEFDQEYVYTLIRVGYNQLWDFDMDDKAFIWAKRAYLSELPDALPFVILSAPAWDALNVSNVYSLLESWAPLSPERALVLLLPCFSDLTVRRKALEWLKKGSPAFLRNHIPQLIESLRFELYENCDLARFLLLQSTKERSFAFELFWQLNQRICENNDRNHRMRCERLQNELILLNIPGFVDELAIQQAFLRRLHEVSVMIKGRTALPPDVVVKNELRIIANEVDLNHLRPPLFPAFQCRGIKYESCGFFESFTKPIRVCLEGDVGTFSLIYKAGDDLRQDAVVMQLINVVDDIWLKEGHDMRMLLFRCLPTGEKRGLIEMVTNCRTFREIQVVDGAQGVYQDDVLDKWLKANNPTEFKYTNAVENFRRSAAGWCVVSYVLGLCDRHNDNMLLCSSGHMFHIDFGRYMGNKQMAGPINRDRVPFVLTADMAYIINGGQRNTTTEFQKFIDEMCTAFNLLRKHAPVLLNMMHFMCNSDIPEMNNDALTFVQGKLELGMRDVEATILLTKLITDSLSDWTTRANFFAHSLAQRSSTNIDLEHMPFNSTECTPEEDGRIESVVVRAIHKWRHPDGGKIYMYECMVHRKDVVVNPPIFRSYQEFETFHFKLRCQFSAVGVPELGRVRFLGRTNIQDVALQRQLELQRFVQMLFDLPNDISHCPLVYNFFHPIHRDVDWPRGAPSNPSPGVAQPPTLLKLQLKLDTNKHRLKIFVGHGQNVRGLHVEEPKTYVKLYLCPPGQEPPGVGKQKTQPVKSKNPTYNCELVYHMLPVYTEQIFDSVLHVAIWQNNSAIKNDNFNLCSTRIQLSQMKNFQTTPNVYSWDNWFTLDY